MASAVRRATRKVARKNFIVAGRVWWFDLVVAVKSFGEVMEVICFLNR